MENPFAKSLADLDRPDYGRLTFDEQCGYYAALRLDVPPAVVAKTSGISESAVSLLKGAGTVRGGQLRYPKVAHEYRGLGHEAFIHRYLTAPIREAIEVSLAAYKTRERNPDINAKGYNPRANRYEGIVFDWPATAELDRVVFVIELHPDLCGYLWRHLSPYRLPVISWDEAAFNPFSELQGDPRKGPERGPDAKGFATSEACYRYVRNLFGRGRAA